MTSNFALAIRGHFRFDNKGMEATWEIAETPSVLRDPHFLRVGVYSWLRDNLSMTNLAAGMHRYKVHCYPYVEVRFENRLPIHAQILGWNVDMIMISAPAKLLDRYSYDQLEVQWVRKYQARRIRSIDSIWASIKDDTAWHEREDAKITYLADPLDSPRARPAWALGVCPLDTDFLYR